MQELVPTAIVHVEDYTLEAKAAGFGTLKKDTDYYPAKKKKKTLMDKIKFRKKEIGTPRTPPLIALHDDVLGRIYGHKFCKFLDRLLLS